jgi:hypothetical protein
MFINLGTIDSDDNDFEVSDKRAKKILKKMNNRGKNKI